MRFYKFLSFFLMLVFSLLANLKLFAQIPSKIWYFGHYNGIDFNYSPPRPLFNSNVYQDESTCTITDELGQLLFYSDKENVYNAKHQIMKNGAGLLGNFGSSIQSPMVIQSPSDPSKFYVFYCADETNPRLLGEFRYSIVDLCGDNENGEVIASQKNVLISGYFSERLTSCSINNGESYWIICSKLKSNEIYSYLLDKNGISNSPIISTVPFNLPAQIGSIVINNRKTKIAYSSCLDSEVGIYLMDFDIITGRITNPKVITRVWSIYDSEFSPDDIFLYYTSIWSTSSVYQYDIQNDKITNLSSYSGNYYYGGIHKGPDGLIYISDTRKKSLSVILNPNNSGTNCNFRENYFKLDPRGENVLGLQNTEWNFGIATDTIYSDFLGNDTTVCDIKNFILSSPSNRTSWSTDTISKRISISKGGKYFALYRNCMTLYVDTIIIKIGSKQKLILPTDTTFCSNFNLQINATKGFSEYSWSNGEKTESIGINKFGSYICCAKDSCNTIVCDTIVIRQDLAFNINITKDTTVTSGSFIQLDVNIINGKPNAQYKYEWSPKSGLSCSDCPNPKAVIKTTQKFRVRITDLLSGCENFAYINIRSVCCKE